MFPEGRAFFSSDSDNLPGPGAVFLLFVVVMDPLHRLPDKNSQAGTRIPKQGLPSDPGVLGCDQAPEQLAEEGAVPCARLCPAEKSWKVCWSIAWWKQVRCVFCLWETAPPFQGNFKSFLSCRHDGGGIFFNCLQKLEILQLFRLWLQRTASPREPAAMEQGSITPATSQD